MKTIHNLNTLINTENIILSYQTLPIYIYGYYQYDSTGHYILISNEEDFLSNDAFHKCVLAEELGHYFTSNQVNNPLALNNHSSKMMIFKEEEKAIRWAADYLIETDELMEYLSFSLDAGIELIAEYFEVTNEMVMKKLYIMSLEKGYWKIIDEIYLCLDNYPSIYYARFLDDKFIGLLDEYFE